MTYEDEVYAQLLNTLGSDPQVPEPLQLILDVDREAAEASHQPKEENDCS